MWVCGFRCDNVGECGGVYFFVCGFVSERVLFCVNVCVCGFVLECVYVCV